MSDDTSKQGLPVDTDSTSPKPGFLKGGRDHWTQMVHSIGVVQTRLLMVLFYIVVAIPTGIFVRLSGDRLRLKRPTDGNWTPHRQEEQSIDTARRQF